LSYQNIRRLRAGRYSRQSRTASDLGTRLRTGSEC
jgi:hypothetical protein